MLTTREQVRVLGPGTGTPFLALAEQDPVVNVFADYRARLTNLEPRWLGGEMWGRFEGERARRRLPRRRQPGAGPVRRRRRRRLRRAAPCAGAARVGTIVGPQRRRRGASGTVVEPRWARPREVRWRPAAPRDRRAVRWSRPTPASGVTTRDDLDVLYPGLRRDVHRGGRRLARSTRGGGDLYRARVRQLIGRGWSFARFDERRVVFKAEVACATPYAAQVQGVWVPPDRRGQGLAVSGHGRRRGAGPRREIAPIVSLYVNDWNTPAAGGLRHGRLRADRDLRDRDVLGVMPRRRVGSDAFAHRDAEHRTIEVCEAPSTRKLIFGVVLPRDVGEGVGRPAAEPLAR